MEVYKASPASPPRQTEHHALATFAIPIDHPAPTAKASPPHRSSDLRFAALLVAGLTLLALLIHGYHPYAEDGGLYLTGIQRLLDPALFPRSTPFVLEPTRLSLFAPTIAAITRITHLPLPQVLLALHITTIWITLFAAWMLAARCFPTRTARAGAVVLLACWLSLPVAGTALVLMDPYLTARSLSTPCMILALVAILDATSAPTKRTRSNAILRCIAAMAIAAAMHPLMAAYALAATAILTCLRSADPRIRLWLTSILSIATLAAAAILNETAKPESAAYRRIALTRTYWFPAQWSWYELIGLAAPLAILAFVALRRPTQIIPPAHRALAQMAIVSGTTAFLVAILFAHPASPSHLIARLQPLRIFQIVYLILVLTLGAKLSETLLKRSLWRWPAAILLLGGIMFSAARSAFPNSPHLELPGTSPRNPWVQAFLWINQHTPKDALFALDPDYINSPHEDAQCFRAIAQRSALPDYSKDGGEASIAPDLTPAWTAGQQAQQALNAPATTDASRLAALTPLGVSWLVLNAQTATRFTCPYANAAVKVCRIP
jgi:hypothetical protein